MDPTIIRPAPRASFQKHLNAVAAAGKSWEKFHKRLHSRLNAILDMTKPRKSVMLAVDGPAPLAKLLTQRERRKVRAGCEGYGIDSTSKESRMLQIKAHGLCAEGFGIGLSTGNTPCGRTMTLANTSFPVRTI